MKYIYLLLYLFVTVNFYNELSPNEKIYYETPSLATLSLDILTKKIDRELEDRTKNVNDIIQLFEGHPEEHLLPGMKEKIILRLIAFSDNLTPKQKIKIIKELKNKEIFASSETQEILSFFDKIFKHRHIAPYLPQTIKSYNLPAVLLLLELVDPNKKIPKRWQENFSYMLYPLSYALIILRREYFKLEDLEQSTEETATERQKKEKETTIKSQKEKMKKVAEIIHELIKTGSNIWLEDEPLLFQPIFLALDIPLSFSHDIIELLEVLLQYNPEEINRIWRDQQNQEITLRDFIDIALNKSILRAENPEEAEKFRGIHQDLITILNKFNAKKRDELQTKGPWPIWPIMTPEQLQRYQKQRESSTR